jgi:carboxypeptidase Taq
MATPSSPLTLLKSHLREIESLNAATALMYWDQATYLPDSGAERRGEHIAHMNKISHLMQTHPDLGRWLEAAASDALSEKLDPESDDACLLRVAKRDYLQAVRIPAEFSAALSAHSSRSYEAWKKARAAGDFSIVSDILKETLELSRRLSGYLALPEHASVMDPLIDLNDPGFRVSSLQPLFGSLRARLLPLLAELKAARPFDRSCLLQNIPEDDQLKFGLSVIRQMGYDFKRGRQDKTHHPFMIRLSQGDVRITTRVKEGDLTEALFSTIHEAGHALYELGIDPLLEGTPLARGSSSGIHESQSRFWENLVGRSRPFWEHFYPKLQNAFSDRFTHTSLETFHRAINRVQPGLIRTDADEVTYNLHVMIRFDLELDLLSGKLAVDDLPEAWNERYRTDLGITPKTLSEGVLQDVHWFHGVIGGAFQGYTIGNILSAQLYSAAQRALPELEAEVRAGEFAGLKNWLGQNLHQYGRKFDGPDLIKRATGVELDVTDYLNYLEGKYRALLASDTH